MLDKVDTISMVNEPVALTIVTLTGETITFIGSMSVWSYKYWATDDSLMNQLNAMEAPRPIQVNSMLPGQNDPLELGGLTCNS